MALKNNQIKAVETIINYIVKFQNSYVSSFLFTKNFLQLVELGLDIRPLLESRIFLYEFDLDDWP